VTRFECWAWGTIVGLAIGLSVLAYATIRKVSSDNRIRQEMALIPPDSASVAVRTADGELFGVYHISDIRVSTENCTAWSFRAGWYPVKATVEPPIGDPDAVTWFTEVIRENIREVPK